MNDHLEDSQAAHPRDPNRKLRVIWIVAMMIAVLILVQWPAFKELYYQLSGIDGQESAIPWLHDFDSALNQAEQSDKPLLVVFGARWCPPCKTMKREVWPDEQVAKVVNAGFIPLYIDVDEKEQAKVIDRYRVTAIPAVLLLNAKGDLVRQRGSMSRSQTLGFLGQTLVSREPSG